MKLVLSALLAALLFAGPATGAFAHEAHQQDMSDAEMAAIMASTHGEAAASIEMGATAPSETLDGPAVSQAAALRQSGALTEAEFDSLKACLLAVVLAES